MNSTLLALYSECETDEQWNELEDYFYEHLSQHAEQLIDHDDKEGTLLIRYLNVLMNSPTET